MIIINIFLGILLYLLKIHKQVSKFLIALPARQRTKIKEKLELLQINPYQNPLLDIKMMQGMDGIYRLRVGKYRILYEINDAKLLVYLMDAGSRGDVYKK